MNHPDFELKSINSSKTVSLLINNRNIEVPNLYLDGEIIKEVTLHKHLGIIITKNLLWTEHIDAVCAISKKD